MLDLPLRLDDLLDESARRLGLVGHTEPRQEARRIWRGLHHGDRHLPGDRHGAIDGERAAAFMAAVARRVNHEPLAYVTGATGFRYLELKCDARALIPRPETEGLVELALERASTGAAADIGTGTGAVALSLAKEGNFDDVFGVDLSNGALALAADNARLNELRVTWLEGDLIAPLLANLAGRSTGARCLDLIVSNPPYLTADEYAELDPTVKSWEPELALISGDDGMSATRRLLTDAGQVLKPGGWLALEVDSRRADLVATVAVDLQWHDVTVHVDLFGRPRYVLGRWENQ